MKQKNAVPKLDSQKLSTIAAGNILCLKFRTYLLSTIENLDNYSIEQFQLL